MPIRIPGSMPAHDILESENIFVMTETRAISQDIRPLKVLILNLMPTKIVTETQLLRKLSNTPLQIDVEFLQTASYTPTHIDQGHLKQFYCVFDQIRDRHFDGMIITGAPLDYVKYEDTVYWKEVCEIMEWTKTHVHCTFHLCWGAYAGLYYHHGIEKKDLDRKLFGVFPHKMRKSTSPLFRGFNDIFMAPHSRATDVNLEDVEAVPDLEVLAVTEDGSLAIAKSRDSRQFFVTCHAEYDHNTLALEYFRDMEKGLTTVDLPINYFPDDDPAKEPLVSWRSTGQLLYSNWLNYYVYQSTPYDIDAIC
ncbi:MAG: homoserine O-succinyltransferase [Lachnospiraceae bacterium]|jgi:homoserine O-succinyltransferase|nr:homoserine O-succinyltransferase [Lachnospiraceae bacterium]MCI9600781.1 homoserine O-succinyltransferase [Lachnospiraceae bacterium]MDE6897243.1 homoserine O-succinyltransferase [Lachnospiraceae bacterium]